MIKDLNRVFDEVLFDDKSIDETKLTTRQKLALSKYRNKDFWNELSRSNKLNTKKKFANLITKYGRENYLNEAKKLLKN